MIILCLKNLVLKSIASCNCNGANKEEKGKECFKNLSSTQKSETLKNIGKVEGQRKKRMKVIKIKVEIQCSDLVT